MFSCSLYIPFKGCAVKSRRIIWVSTVEDLGVALNEFSGYSNVISLVCSKQMNLSWRQQNKKTSSAEIEDQHNVICNCNF